MMLMQLSQGRKCLLKSKTVQKRLILSKNRIKK